MMMLERYTFNYQDNTPFDIFQTIAKYSGVDAILARGYPAVLVIFNYLFFIIHAGVAVIVIISLRTFAKKEPLQSFDIF
jgi:hypothetical protein